MIDVKTAVRTAMKYLQEFDDFVPARDVRLEETEYDDKGNWLITLSALDDPNRHPGALGIFSAGKRSYKIFRIDAISGEVKSMKVRTLQPVD
jgi:hypothetical protein